MRLVMSFSSVKVSFPTRPVLSLSLSFLYALTFSLSFYLVFYYRRKRALYPELFLPSTPSLSIPIETDPLLSAFSASPSPSHPYSKQVKKYRDILSLLGAVIGIVLLGTLAWKFSANTPTEARREVWDTKAQVVGWMSAFLYCKFFSFLSSFPDELIPFFISSSRSGISSTPNC